MDKNNIIEHQQSIRHLEESTIKSALNRLDVEAPDIDAAWNDLRGKLALPEEEPSHPIRWDLVWKTVVSIAAILVIGFVLVIDNKKDDFKPLASSLDNSENTSISSSSVTDKAKEDGVAKNSVGQQVLNEEIVTAETGQGQSLHLTLADGTKVWLNADSKLLYPKRFVGDGRKVTLEGEGYFEVKHDVRHPFVVETAQMIATDLGTAFDMKAYKGRSPQLALVSGSVAVQAKGDASQVVLKPNEMASLEDGKLSVCTVDTYPMVQWKNGLFYFHDAPLIDVMKDLGRWYHAKVVFENKECLQTQVHFVAERSESLKAIVEQLNEIEGVNVFLVNHELSVR